MALPLLLLALNSAYLFDVGHGFIKDDFDSVDHPEWSAGIRQSFRLVRDTLKLGQRVLIVSTWQQFGLAGYHRHYVVSVPDARLPDGIPVTIYMNADGLPDPRVCEPVN